MFATHSPFARENAELRALLGQWEAVAAILRPLQERTGTVDAVALHNAVARLASLALASGVPHAAVMNAVKPDPRGAVMD